MGILDTIKGAVKGQAARTRESAEDLEEAASSFNPLRNYEEGYREAMDIPEPEPAIAYRGSRSYQRGYDSRMAELSAEDYASEREARARAKEVEKGLDRMEALQRRQREADIQMAEASVEARLRKARDVKRAAQSDSLKSKLIRGLLGTGRKSGGTVPVRAPGAYGGGSGGRSGRKKGSKKGVKGTRIRAASPISYNPLAYRTTPSGLFASTYRGGFLDMDIFGRYGEGDLDIYGRPKSGRLFFSTNLFP